MQTTFLFILFLMTIGFFGTVEALHCYEQGIGSYDDNPGRDNLKSGECPKHSTGCSAVLYCGSYPDLRGCTPDKDFCQKEVSEGKTFRDICKYCEYCEGNLCNDKGLEKTGLKCIGKDKESGEAFVEECLTGTVGCIAAWNCKGRPKITEHGCSARKDFCKQEMLNFDGQPAVSEVCNCIFCTSDLCNDGGIMKPTLDPRLKCFGKTILSNWAFVEECPKGTVGCFATWDCKGAEATIIFTTHGCSPNKDFCKEKVRFYDKTFGDVCSCNLCTTDLCNDGGIKVKPTIKEEP